VVDRADQGKRSGRSFTRYGKADRKKEGGKGKRLECKTGKRRAEREKKDLCTELLKLISLYKREEEGQRERGRSVL